MGGVICMHNKWLTNIQNQPCCIVANFCPRKFSIIDTTHPLHVFALDGMCRGYCMIGMMSNASKSSRIVGWHCQMEGSWSSLTKSCPSKRHLKPPFPKWDEPCSRQIPWCNFIVQVVGREPQWSWKGFWNKQDSRTSKLLLKLVSCTSWKLSNEYQIKSNTLLNKLGRAQLFYPWVQSQ